MTVIAVDSSGHVRYPPICYVAVRHRGGQQTHNCVYVDKATHDQYIDFSDDWAEKLSAALIFRTVRTVLSSSEMFRIEIKIDTDFQGRHEKVRRYMHTLYNEEYFRAPNLQNPTIEFIPEKDSGHVKVAHTKALRAWHRDREIPREDPTGLDRLLDILS